VPVPPPKVPLQSSSDAGPAACLAGDEVVGEQEDSGSGAGGEPGRGVENPCKGGGRSRKVNTTLCSLREARRTSRRPPGLSSVATTSPGRRRCWASASSSRRSTSTTVDSRLAATPRSPRAGSRVSGSRGQTVTSRGGTRSSASSRLLLRQVNVEHVAVECDHLNWLRIALIRRDIDPRQGGDGPWWRRRVTRWAMRPA